MLGEHDWFLIVWALVCIIVVLAMSYWVTRFVAGKGVLRSGAFRHSTGQIEILSQELLGRDQRLVIARIGEKYFLLGVTANSISLLAELSGEDAVSFPDALAQEAEKNPGFFETFSDALKQRTRR